MAFQERFDRMGPPDEELDCVLIAYMEALPPSTATLTPRGGLYPPRYKMELESDDE